MKKLWNQYCYPIILIVISCSLAFMLSLDFHPEGNKKYLKITVSEGDSLWEISKKYSKQHSLSNVEFVNWVKLHNEIMDEQIFPGEKLVIPVSKTVSTLTEVASAVE